MLDSFEIPGFGKIDIAEIYSYYDGPVLFSGVREATQSLYLIVFADEDDDKDTWLCVMISPERLKQVEAGEIDLHDAFAKPEQGWLTYVQVKGRNLRGIGFCTSRESPVKLLSVERRIFRRESASRLNLKRNKGNVAARYYSP